MKTYMPLNGLRWSHNSGSANCDMPQSVVFGRPGGGIVGRSGYFNLNLSDNSVTRERVHVSRTMKDLVADLRDYIITLTYFYL